MTLRAGTFVRLTGATVKLGGPVQATVAHPAAHIVAQTVATVRIATSGGSTSTVPTVGQLWPRGKK